MPSSSASLGSGSHSSLSSSKRRNRQYRVLAQNSQVDEALFGSPQHIQQRDGLLNDKWQSEAKAGEVTVEKLSAKRSGKGRSHSSKNKETVQVITKDLIRNLIVPSEDPSGHSVVLTRRDFQRIREASRVLTKAEREALMERIKKEREEAQDACTERKNFMSMMDMNRKKNVELNELEEEAKARSLHLLEKANEQVQEQDDEIKRLNELILDAKCHAIRDAQVLEKRIISGEMTEEEKRLDIMMEIERQNKVRIQAEIEAKRRESRFVGAARIQEQIEENEQEKLLELERKDQENLQMQKTVEKMILEDKTLMEAEHERKIKMRADLNKANDELLVRKEQIKEQEKALDRSVAEYMRKKGERDAEFEKEQERIRIEKEREVAKLRSLQERAKDEQAERDALRAKRAAEAYEREWRKKEAEEVRKNLEMGEMLKVARAHQMEEKEHVLAVQANRDRIEFERVLRAQKEILDKEKRIQEKRAKHGHAYANEIRDQIREKEQQKIQERSKFFEEGLKLNEEAKLRRQKIEDIKRKKLQELRECGIPDKYAAQIERKVNQPAQLSA